MKTVLIRHCLGVPLWRWAILALTAIMLALISVVLRGALDLEWSLGSLRKLIGSYGFWGPIAYVAILTFRFLVLIPSSILLIASGIMFGPVYGALWAGIGLSLSGLLKFAFVAVVGRDVVLRQLPEGMREWVLKAAHTRQSGWALFAICAYPMLPKHVFQVSAILSGMSLVVYAISIGAGSFIRGALFAVLGEALYSGEGVLLATIVLAAFVALPVLHPASRAWLLTTISPDSQRKESS